MAGEYNFTIDQGSDNPLTCTYKDSLDVPVNLTGMSIQSFARANKEDTYKKFEFTITISNQTTYPGQFLMTLPSATSSALDIKKLNQFFYDVELTNGLTKERLFQGVVTINREITR